EWNSDHGRHRMDAGNRFQRRQESIEQREAPCPCIELVVAKCELRNQQMRRLELESGALELDETLCDNGRRRQNHQREGQLSNDQHLRNTSGASGCTLSRAPTQNVLEFRAR